ncbi:signal peptidase I [Catenulispora sp. NF23]|uniref:Signal peptidase I n=1 Tax=Catenulispora pinistramenti TaxID=2705254 RepID=A0ABS5L2T5_9ACTN|nr:signal peptidase I [Catenulispora pinistramenti]MBS2536569.1 signal peptidase I [Catenulispora pinistramenti]MBS2552565.1 signal peptidase I [Catenulispora pinistramenti]
MAKGQRRRLKPVKLWKELPILFGVALLLALVIKTFFVQAYFIPSQSMQHTIEPGDRVLVNKLTPWFGWTPERGQIVVFKDPGGWLDPSEIKKDNAFVGGVKKVFSWVGLLPEGNEQDLIKRVVGVPGDVVQCKGVGQPVTVNGVPLDEHSYLYRGVDGQLDDPSQTPFGPITVQPHTVFVLGDHRSDSGDSRVHLQEASQGLVPYSDMQGHAFVRIWPLTRISGLGTPSTFSLKNPAQAVQGAATVPPVLWAFTLAVPLRAGSLRRRRRRAGALLPDPAGVTNRLRGRLGTERPLG